MNDLGSLLMRLKETFPVTQILTSMLALIFVVAGTAKLLGLQIEVELFTKWGYSDEFRLFIGAAEVIGAIGLFLPRFVLFAAGGLGVIMAGAIYTHLRHAEIAQAIIPLGLLILLAFVIFLRNLPRIFPERSTPAGLQ